MAGCSRIGPPMIFILDDDMATRDSLRLLLACEGLQAHEFASGRAFLDGVPTSEDGCLLLDLQMPGMSGLEVLEALRRRGDKRPVIIITSHPTPSARDRAAAAGVLAFVEKPYRVDTLLDLVHRALEHRPASDTKHRFRSARRRSAGRRYDGGRRDRGEITRMRTVPQRRPVVHAALPSTNSKTWSLHGENADTRESYKPATPPIDYYCPVSRD